MEETSASEHVYRLLHKMESMLQGLGTVTSPTGAIAMTRNISTATTSTGSEFSVPECVETEELQKLQMQVNLLQKQLQQQSESVAAAVAATVAAASDTVAEAVAGECVQKEERLQMHVSLLQTQLQQLQEEEEEGGILNSQLLEQLQNSQALYREIESAREREKENVQAERAREMKAVRDSVAREFARVLTAAGHDTKIRVREVT